MPRLRPFVRVRRPACSRALSVEAHKSEAEKFPRKLCRKWRGDRKSMYANLRRTALHESRCRTDGGIPSFGIILSIPGSRFICLQTVVCPSVVRPPAAPRTNEAAAATQLINQVE